MAIDSTDKNRAWAARRWTWVLGAPRADLKAGVLVGLALLGGGASCSKGGAPDTNGCPKLSDAVPGDDSAPPLRANYVMLKSTSGALIPVTLDGAGGSYAGTHLFTQCDQTDPYTVSQIVLVTKQGDPLATATNVGGSYQVSYANSTAKVPAVGDFANLSSTFTDAAMTPAVTLQMLTASAPTVNQGEAITINVGMTGGPCAIRESKWWLTTTMGPVTDTTPVIAAMQTIAGGSGSATLRVPPSALMGSYNLGGQVTLSSGRVLQIRRSTTDTDARYALFDGKNVASPIVPIVPGVAVTVMTKADVDKTAPQAVEIAVSPVAPVRCGTLNLTLHLKDDQPLPAGQQVKVWVGQNAQTKLSAVVVGSEYLSGTLQLPIDAPAGPWYAWPDVIRDAAGNEARATFNPSDGTFSLSGQDAMAKPVLAAKFMLASTGTELPDAATPPLDLGMAVDLGGQPDMAMPPPVVLKGISVMPGQAKNGDTITVYVNWMDNAKVL